MAKQVTRSKVTKVNFDVLKWNLAKKKKKKPSLSIIWKNETSFVVLLLWLPKYWMKLCTIPGKKWKAKTGLYPDVSSRG